MGRNETKSLIELSDEELELLAQNNEKIVGLKTDSDVQSFLVRFDITPGNEEVSLNTIHRFYKFWSERPIHKPQFTEELGILLNQPSSSIYKLNKAPVEFVKQSKKEKRPVNLITFYTFIQDEKIKEGKYYIHIEALRRLYNKWAHKKKVIKVNSKRFKAAISKFLKIEIQDTQPYILVDKKTSKKLVELVHDEQKETKKQTRSN